MSKTKRLLLIVAIVGALLGFLATTDPKVLPIGALLVPFALFGAAIYNIFYLLIDLFRYSPNNPLKQRAMALTLAVLLTNFAVLQSVGRLTIQDIVLAVTITLIIVFYISRIQKTAN